MATSAIVLLSGGLDSATTLALSRHQGFACHALSFDYGQRHRFELQAAKRVAEHLGAVEHLVMKIDLRAFGGSALTADIEVPKHSLPLPLGEGRGEGGGGSDSGRANALTADPSPGGRGESIPITYVPARNTIFLSFALAFAEVRDATDIFIGVSAIDYSGYPDCRPEFIEAFERLANLATRVGVEHAADHQPPLRIHAPIIHMSKAQTIRRGLELGVDYSLTHSCYDPIADTGVPCGRCESCTLRAAGFRQAGVTDPLARK